MKSTWFLFFVIFLFSAGRSVAQGCTASLPTGLSVTGKSACQATLHWDQIPNISYYQVKFKINGASAWTKISTHLHDTLYAFTGLLPDTKYVFGVRSVCTTVKSKYATKKATTKECETPEVTAIQVNDDLSVSITWQTDCSTSFNQLRFRPVANAVWKYLSTGTTQSILIDSLTAGTTYVFQVAACSDTTGHWSAVDSFSIAPLPNILLIILDDARYDSYSSNGAPSFFQSPSIDRIANEGVNFKNSFAVYSLCAPSRSTIFTGLYPHKSGGYNNAVPYNESLPTIGTILHEKGYYTALIGKYLMPTLPNDPQPGWDFWMAQDKWAKIDPKYNYNGTVLKMKGHEMNIATDTAIHVFSTKSDLQPLLMMLCYLSPHEAYIPMDEDVGAFANETMPIPSNFYKYLNNYPSFYNTLTISSYSDSDSLRIDLEAYFEVMRGLDRQIGRLLDTIEAMNKLDNTLVLFMSDNGFLFGEHMLSGKSLPHEPSIRLPVYARYPKWFTPGTISTSQLVTNLDVAPTVLAAAGVANTYGMDGFSLHDLYKGTKKRDAFYIELIQDPVTELNEYPDFRSVRSKKYKYNYYFCTDVAEEFFDLTLDPQENTNQINNPSYQSLIAQYRVKLDSFKTVLQDTVPGGVFTCNLIVNPPKTSEEKSIDFGIQFYPNPASDKLMISIDDKDCPSGVSLYSSQGELVLQEKWNTQKGKRQLILDVSDLPNGIYSTAIQYCNKLVYRKLVVLH